MDSSPSTPRDGGKRWRKKTSQSAPDACTIDQHQGPITRQEHEALLAACERKYGEEISQLKGALNRQNDRHAVTLQEEREVSTVASKAAEAAAEEAERERAARLQAEQVAARHSEEVSRLTHLYEQITATTIEGKNRAGSPGSPGSSGSGSPNLGIQAKLRECEDNLAREIKARKSAQRICDETATQLEQAIAERQTAKERVAEVLASSSEQLAAARRQEEELVHENTQLQRQLQELKEQQQGNDDQSKSANSAAAAAAAAASEVTSAASARSLQLALSEATELRAEVSRLQAALRTLQKSDNSAASAAVAPDSPGGVNTRATIEELRRELRRYRVSDEEREEETVALRKEVVRLRAEITVLNRERRVYSSSRGGKGAHKSTSQPVAPSGQPTRSAAGRTYSGGSSSSSSNPEERALMQRVEAAEAQSAALAAKLCALQMRQVPPPSPEDGGNHQQQQEQMLAGVDPLLSATPERAQVMMALADRSGSAASDEFITREGAAGEGDDGAGKGSHREQHDSSSTAVTARERLEREKWKRVARHEKQQREKAEAALSQSLGSLHELEQQQQLNLYYGTGCQANDGPDDAVAAIDGVATLLREVAEWKDRHGALERRYAERVAAHREALKAAHAAHEQIIEEATAQHAGLVSAHAAEQLRQEQLEGSLQQSRKEALRWREQQHAAESELVETKRALAEAERALAEVAASSGDDDCGGQSLASRKTQQQKLSSFYGKQLTNRVRASAREDHYHHQ
eukprot:COSAG05_NODE_139_length_16772_cov_35.582559_8_plen_750_part_00